MNNEVLDNLVASGDIVSYSYLLKDMDNLPITESEGSRETETLVITFPSGSQLTIDTFCSGSAENTCLIFNHG